MGCERAGEVKTHRTGRGLVVVKDGGRSTDTSKGSGASREERDLRSTGTVVVLRS